MIRKLLKYDIKSIWKIHALIFMVVILICVIFGGITKIVLNTMGDYGTLVVEGISMPFYLMFYFELAVAVLIVVAVLNIVRFVKGVWGKDGYIIQTLPVCVHGYLATRILMTLFWELCAVLVILLGEVILNWGTEGFIDGLGIWILASFYDEFELITGTGEMLVLVVYMCTQVYASIAVGQSFNKGKIVVAILFYIFTTFAAVCTALLLGDALLDKWVVGASNLFRTVFCAVLGGGYYALTAYFVKNEKNVC